MLLGVGLLNVITYQPVTPRVRRTMMLMAIEALLMYVTLLSSGYFGKAQAV